MLCRVSEHSLFLDHCRNLLEFSTPFVIRLLILSSQWSRVPAPSSGVYLPAGTGCFSDSLWDHLPPVAMATEAALPPPAGDLGILLCGRLLLLSASVHQPAEAGGEAQTAVRRRPVPERSQVRSPNTHLHPFCIRAPEEDTQSLTAHCADQQEKITVTSPKPLLLFCVFPAPF